MELKGCALRDVAALNFTYGMITGWYYILAWRLYKCLHNYITCITKYIQYIGPKYMYIHMYMYVHCMCLGVLCLLYGCV